MQNPIPLRAAIQAAKDNPEQRDDSELKACIDKILSAALALNFETEKLKKTGPNQKLPYVGDWKGWIDAQAGRLDELKQRMLSFNFTVVVENLPVYVPGSRGLVFWNYLNLFFLHGMYFEQPFAWTVGWHYNDTICPPVVNKNDKSIALKKTRNKAAKQKQLKEIGRYRSRLAVFDVVLPASPAPEETLPRDAKGGLKFARI